MADKTGLQRIGWLMATVTGAVMLIAALLVHDAVQSPSSASDEHAAYAALGSAPVR